MMKTDRNPSKRTVVGPRGGEPAPERAAARYMWVMRYKKALPLRLERGLCLRLLRASLLEDSDVCGLIRCVCCSPEAVS